jgi:hypothetical protein
MTGRTNQVRSVSKRGVIRWGLTILLSCVSVFFLYSGFITGLLAAGGKNNPAHALWEYQASARFTLGLVLWLGSVMAFLFLRPGGIGLIFRGNQISTPKRWLYTIALVLSTFAALYALIEVWSLRHLQ